MNKKMIILTIAIVLIVTALGVGYFFTTNQNNSTHNEQPETENNEQNNNIGQEENNEQNDNIEQEENNEGEETMDKKIGIVYFSATGTTQTVAEYIENITNGDLIEIVPKDEYTTADLNYNNDDCRANKEQNDANSRPEIANDINVDEYDIIYLGFPIWWGDVPKIILTFLDTYDLSGKTVIPFCTSGGSGISTSMRTLRNYNENVNWLEGSRLSTSQSSVSSWIDGLNY